MAAIGLASGVKHGKGAVAKKLVEIAACRTLQHIDFQLGKQIHRAEWADLSNQLNSLTPARVSGNSVAAVNKPVATTWVKIPGSESALPYFRLALSADI